jgi:hypothetical protein
MDGAWEEGRALKENQDAISSKRRGAAGQAKTTDVHSNSFELTIHRSPGASSSQRTEKKAVSKI